MTKSKMAANEGLGGFFGHLYTADPDFPDEQIIQYQFRVIRRMDAERWIVQFFSYLTGEPTQIGVYPESVLLGETVKLYPDEAGWLGAAEQDGHRYRLRHRRESA